MAEKVEIEIFIVMDDAGNYAVGVDEDEANESFDSNIGGHPRRMAKIKAKMAPAIVAKAEVDIPDEAGSTEQIEVEAA